MDNYIENYFHFYNKKKTFENRLKQGLINPDSICFINETGQIFTQGVFFSITRDQLEYINNILDNHERILKNFVLGEEGDSIDGQLIDNLKEMAQFLSEFPRVDENGNPNKLSVILQRMIDQYTGLIDAVNEDLQNKYDDITNKINNLNSSQTTIANDLSALEGQVSKNKIDINQRVDREVADLRTVISDSNSSMDDIVEQNKQLMEQKVSELHDRVDHADSNISTNKVIIDRHTDEIGELTRKSSSLKNDIDLLRTYHDDFVNNQYQPFRTSTENSIRNINNALDFINGTAESEDGPGIKGSIPMLTDRVVVLESLINNWEDRINQTETNIADVYGRIQHVDSQISELQSEIANIKSSVGVPHGIAPLDSNGLIPSAHLPSFVDDVLEYQSIDAFPIPGESGKIYVALDTNLQFRWSGTLYVEISKSLALGETPSTAFPGSEGARLRNELESHKNASNPHNIDKYTIDLGQVDNTSDINKPVSNPQREALNAITTELDAHKTAHNPHGISREFLGLDKVDNTADMDKPISNSMQEAINTVNNSIVNHTSDNNNPHNVTKEQLGIGNADGETFGMVKSSDDIKFENGVPTITKKINGLNTLTIEANNIDILEVLKTVSLEGRRLIRITNETVKYDSNIDCVDINFKLNIDDLFSTYSIRLYREFCNSTVSEQQVSYKASNLPNLYTLTTSEYTGYTYLTAIGNFDNDTLILTLVSTDPRYNEYDNFPAASFMNCTANTSLRSIINDGVGSSVSFYNNPDSFDNQYYIYDNVDRLYIKNKHNSDIDYVFYRVNFASNENNFICILRYGNKFHVFMTWCNIISGVNISHKITYHGTLNSTEVPLASSETPGIVKPGEGLSVSDEGTLGLSAATTDSIGGVKVGNGLTVSSDGTIDLSKGTTPLNGNITTAISVDANANSSILPLPQAAFNNFSVSIGNLYMTSHIAAPSTHLPSIFTSDVNGLSVSMIKLSESPENTYPYIGGPYSATVPLIMVGVLFKIGTTVVFIGSCATSSQNNMKMGTWFGYYNGNIIDWYDTGETVNLQQMALTED